MNELSERLNRGAAELQELEDKREAGTLSPADRDREYSVLATELWDLEEDILSDPGDLQQYLVPVRRERLHPRRSRSADDRL